MATVYLSLGSNLGNRQQYLKHAAEMLNEAAGDVISCSSLWETEPWGFSAANLFLNMVVVLITPLAPEDLLEAIHVIEKELGRKRTGSGYQSRTIDIDILFSDNDVVVSEDLVIPHPAIADRLFVLMPLNEVASGYCHPLTGKTVGEMLDACSDRSSVRYFSASFCDKEGS